MTNTLTATLFVGIDVSSMSNYVYAMDFFGNKLLSFQATNNQLGAESIVTHILHCLKEKNLSYLTIAMESTSFYSWHLANFLSSNE